MKEDKKVEEEKDKKKKGKVSLCYKYVFTYVDCKQSLLQVEERHNYLVCWPSKCENPWLDGFNDYNRNRIFKASMNTYVISAIVQLPGC